jgi:retron-type reverse transcriptase
VTWEEYETGLEVRLEPICTVRFIVERTGRKPREESISRRPTVGNVRWALRALEGKIVQPAVVTILNEIYEVDFLGFSYGFRPGRSPHQALDALSVGLHRKRVNWVLDADIRGFFDQMSHQWTMKFIQHRVADQRILRLIQKWLKAGVSEDGKWSETK